MGCWVGITNRRNWWSKPELKISGDARFRLNTYMSRTRFEGILVSLRFKDKKDVEYSDGFFHMRKIEEAWNLNMDEEFNPSLINLLDKSMMEWFNIFAPVLMCVGLKPHHFCNERHTIFCVLTSILWRAQIVEAKYHPRPLGQKEYNKLGKR